MKYIYYALAAAFIPALILNISPKLIYFDDGSGTKMYEGIHTRVGVTGSPTKEIHDYSCADTNFTAISDCVATEKDCNNSQDLATTAILIPLLYLVAHFIGDTIVSVMSLDGPTTKMTVAIWRRIATPIILLTEWAIILAVVVMLTMVTTDSDCHQHMAPALILVWVLWGIETVVTVPVVYMTYTGKAFEDSGSDYSESLQNLLGA